MTMRCRVPVIVALGLACWTGPPPDALRAEDWPQWGGSSLRNNVTAAADVPTHWNIGRFDRRTGQWQLAGAQNVTWVARLGSQTYGTPVVAGGRVWIGTNNDAGYLPRYPADTDLGCLLCFRACDGEFLWQDSSEKLATGRAHDWPQQGICSTPLVEGERLWYVTSRGEVVCLDVRGFEDGEDDGLQQTAPAGGGDADDPRPPRHEADVVWRLDMMSQLQVSQLYMSSCSVTSLGDLLFVNTSNGWHEPDSGFASLAAPSFLALDKHTGTVVWSDNTPGENLLHGQWSSPAAGVLGGVPQVIFAGGDGWVYSFRAEANDTGRPEMLWKFDTNPKESKWVAGGAGSRNTLVATPVLHDGLVYVAVGQDPEFGAGSGRIWCIDPTRRGDVSPTLAVRADDPGQVLPPRRIQAVIPAQGETTVRNPQSAVVWEYSRCDRNGNGEIEFEEEMHRSCGSVAIRNDLLVIGDFAGIVHCLDAKQGTAHWTYDMLAAVWGSPLIVSDRVYLGDEDGDICIFELSADPQEPLAEINVGASVCVTPVVANQVLWIATRTHLLAIENSDP